MSEAGRIKLGKEWKMKLLANKAAGKRVYVVPRQVTMDHPYIKEADAAEGKPAEKEKGAHLFKKGGKK